MPSPSALLGRSRSTSGQTGDSRAVAEAQQDRLSTAPQNWSVPALER